MSTNRQLKPASRWWALVPIVIVAFLGALIGAPIGASLYTPNPDAFLDFGGLEYGFWGGVIGALVGASLGWIWWALVSGRGRRRSSYS